MKPRFPTLTLEYSALVIGVSAIVAVVAGHLGSVLDQFVRHLLP